MNPMKITQFNHIDINADLFYQAMDLMERYLQQRLDEDLGPGVALALTDRQQLLGVFTLGWADLIARQQVTPDTLFQIGSISKSFTALACLQLVEAGSLELEAPVTKYLDWFEVVSDFDKPVTIHHLLSHTSGLVGMIDTVPNSPFQLWQLRNTRLGFVPGEHFSYSNLGYVLLGRVLEKITEMTYAEIIRTRLLDPLAMTASEPLISHDIYPRIAHGYWSTHYDDRPAKPAPSPYPSPWFEFRNASGSVACNAADLATFLRMLLNQGQGDQQTVLSPASFQLMITPQEGSYDEYAHGYGLFIQKDRDYQGQRMIWNGGEMIGYHAVLQGDLTAGIGVVVLVNGEAYGMVEAEFAMKVLSAVVNGEALPELPEPPPAPTFVSEPERYAGHYSSPLRSFDLEPSGEQLLMRYAGERLVLEEIYPGVFRVPHPDFDRAPLKVLVQEDAPPEACYGSQWFWGEGYTGPASFDYPAEWDSYAGHYHTYSPWMNDFRIYVRKGQLYLQWWGLFESPLTPLGNGIFRYGETDYSPERLSFDAFVDGKATRATLSGGEYYRIESP
jgi:D-alanyl-D-alanine carboxypeptidase